MRYHSTLFTFLLLLLVLIFFSCKKSEENTAPTAIINLQPDTGSVYTTFKVYGSNSYDQQDYYFDMFYRFDWEHDDSLDVEWSNYPLTQRKFDEEGSYVIRMEIMDTDGMTDETIDTVVVLHGEGPCPGIEQFTYHGQVYNTVKVGSQCWMKENMNWSTGVSWCYDNDEDNCQKFGRLYNWETALSVCPEGWHLPTDKEWKVLEAETDGYYPLNHSEWDKTGWRGLHVGLRLKSRFEWISNGNGIDAEGFNAFPGGYSFVEGFAHLGNEAFFWTSTEDEKTSYQAWYRKLSSDSKKISRGNGYKSWGRSVRCVKDGAE